MLPGRESAVRVLVFARADPDAASQDGMTPVLVAVSSRVHHAAPCDARPITRLRMRRPSTDFVRISSCFWTSLQVL
jgi:hypothetical protein